MEKNVCGLERIARTLVGIGFILVGFRYRAGDSYQEDAVSLGQVLSFYAGADLLVTSLVQWCPTNYILGINTCKREWRSILKEGPARKRRPRR